MLCCGRGLISRCVRSPCDKLKRYHNYRRPRSIGSDYYHPSNVINVYVPHISETVGKTIGTSPEAAPVPSFHRRYPDIRYISGKQGLLVSRVLLDLRCAYPFVRLMDQALKLLDRTFEVTS